MAYPKHDPDATGVPASPSLPEVERRVLDHWAGGKSGALAMADMAGGGALMRSVDMRVVNWVGLACATPVVRPPNPTQSA